MMDENQIINKLDELIKQQNETLKRLEILDKPIFGCYSRLGVNVPPKFS